jgi:hypothetical protein
VYRAGELVWSSAPLAVANLSGGGEIKAQADAALSFAAGPRARITIIPNVVVSQPFTTRIPAPDDVVAPDWVERARRL